jgi:F0F1-type ATP synthase epsilon subunit
MTIRCEIVSQDRTVFAGDVDIVVLPGAAGEMGILPKHAPVLTTLKYGIVSRSAKAARKNCSRWLAALQKCSLI